MAKTTFTTSNALTKKLFDEQLFRDVRKATFWDKFTSTNSNSIIHEKTQLEKSSGDKITIGLRMRLAGVGVTSGQTLEGNEEALSTYDMNISLERYRHAVRDKGELDRKRAVFSIDEESKAALKDWGAEKIDQLAFDALGIGSGSSVDPTKIFYINDSSGAKLATATAATAKAAIGATNSKLSLELISFIKTNARTGGGRNYIPLRPITIKGKDHYVLLVHPDALYDLKSSSAWLQANREARERSDENPIFTGAVGMYDGVVIHEHENCAIATDGGGGGNVPWTKAVLMGAQSLVWAWGKKPETKQKEFDYDEEHGYSWAMTCGVAKSKFNSIDYGSVGIYLARTNVSGY